jgi:RNA polymerase sigma factor (sigma-70 family)
MADTPLAPVVRHLRKLLRSSQAEATDAHLLERYIRQRDEEAFAALVRRHGPLVWRVCRRVVGHVQHAEEAYQATFLVLSQRAAKIRKPEALASWLYGVAYRIARQVRTNLLRRQAYPHPMSGQPVADPAQEAAWRELERLVVAEVHSLAEKYRAPLLLCYWEGLTNDEASRRLGWPAGTVKTRLLKARQLLHERLKRRGVSLSAGAMVTLLASGGSDAAVPPDVMAGALRTVLGGVSSPTAALADQAVRGMSGVRVKIVVALLLLASGAGALAYHGLAMQPPPEKRSAQPDSPAKEAASPHPAKEERQSRVDGDGNPLPPGALARLGTTKLRPMASALAFRDDRTLVTCGSYRIVRFWDVATGKVGKEHSLPGLDSRVVVFSRDGKRLALLEAEGTRGMSVWDVDSGKRLLVLPWEANQFYLQAAFSPDGQTLATAEYSGAHVIRLWDLATGKGRVLCKPTHFLHLMAFSPDGKRLALAVQDGTLVFWDVADGKELWKRPQMPRGMGFSPDGRWLAVGDPRDPVHVRLIDTANGKALPEYKFPDVRDVFRVQFAPDGKILAIGTNKGIILWDLPAKKQRHFLDGADFTFAFAPDGKTLISLGAILQRWDVTTGKPLYEDTSQRGHTRVVQMLSWSPDGERLASVAGSNDSPVFMWSATKGRLQHVVAGQTGGEWPGWRFTAFTPDGKYLVSGSDHLFRVTDAVTSRVVREWPTYDPARKEPNGWLANCRLSRDGKTVIALTQDLKTQPATWLKTWDVATGERRLSRSLTFRGAASAHIAPDGLSILFDQGVCYDVPADKVRYQLALDGGTQVYSGHGYVFSPDGRLIAAMIQDAPLGTKFPEVKGLQLWQAATGKALLRLQVPEYCGSTFSPDGRFLATYSMESLRLWEIVSAKEVLQLPVPGRLLGGPSPNHAVAFSPDGRSLAAGLHDTTILIWDMMPAAREVSRPLSAEQQESLWNDLAASDAAKAYRAIGRLIARPAEALPLLRTRLRPVVASPDERVKRLLADLDSNEFARREAASRELAALGERAEPALRDALNGNPALELRRRIEQLLAPLDADVNRTPETLRNIRAVCVLEQIGNAEARRVLEQLARGTAGARLTREARAALKKDDFTAENAENAEKRQKEK